MATYKNPIDLSNSIQRWTQKQRDYYFNHLRNLENILAKVTKFHPSTKGNYKQGKWGEVGDYSYITGNSYGHTPTITNVADFKEYYDKLRNFMYNETFKEDFDKEYRDQIDALDPIDWEFSGE